MRLGGLPLDSEQDRRFLQDRVALWSQTVFWISTMFLVVGIALDAPAGNPVFDSMRLTHIVGTLLALGMWLLTRSRYLLSPGWLQLMDSAMTVLMSLVFTLLGYQIPEPNGPETALLAIVHVTVGRAIVVPSTPRRTLIITAFSFLGAVVARGFVPIPETYPDGLIGRIICFYNAALWGAAGTILSTVASKVVYGLQEQVLEARQLGQYTLEERIGAGGMGEIYRAQHAMLRRPTAVKLLIDEKSESQLRRFEKEVRLTAALTHPNTISIYDYGRTPDGTFYYAMELLDGMSLETLVDDHGRQPAARVIHILLQVCGALREAHGVGLIHRDIKPGNIFLCHRGGIPDVVKVLDFGLVKQIQSDESLSQTQINAIVGTPLYMSPEAIVTPEQVDARSDLYGLGAVAYQLLTGKSVFSGSNVVEICSHHLHTPPTPPSERIGQPLAADLEQIVLSCLAKSPSQRPEDAAQLASSLRACADAAEWTEDRAREWWRSRIVSTAPVAADDKPLRRTIHVDMEARVSGTHMRLQG